MSLSEAELQAFQSQLERIEAQLNTAMRTSSEEVKLNEKSKGYSQHQADEGTEDFDRTIHLELTKQEFRILKQVQRARQKIAEKTYGICDVTGEEIPRARLLAVPYATMTVQAQERLEKGAF